LSRVSLSVPLGAALRTRSLHDALPIWLRASSCTSLYLRPIRRLAEKIVLDGFVTACRLAAWPTRRSPSFVNATIEGVVRAPSLRSEEHTSELQSCENLVCRLLLEKKHQ